MTHSDPDLLAMMAMGETDLPGDGVAHIRSCPECMAELRSLERVARLARSGSPDDALGEPGPEVWVRISESLGLRADLVPPGGAPPAPVSRRPWRAVAIGAGALALAAAVVAAVLVLRPVDAAVATARLVSPPGGPASAGEAVVERGDGGARDVVVHVEGLPASDGYHEVWLLSEDGSRLIGLGVIEGADGRFAVPEGVDLADYPVVDISAETIDGDPAHSGDSVLRGTLRT